MIQVRVGRQRWRHVLLNFPLMIGSVVLLGLFIVVLFGPLFAPENPYLAGNRVIEYKDGQLMVPPFPPSAEIPIGTDQWGRDILSILLYGTRNTLVACTFITMARLILGLSELHRRRDRTFGNGRAVRNLFEQAVRRMANRIANIAELSAEKLMLLKGSDLAFESLPEGTDLAADDHHWRFHVGCPECHHASDVPGSYLGRRVRCPKCQRDFVAEWGEPVAADR